MKYVKMLGLAAVAVAALMAFVAAGSASATVLCTTSTNPCTSKWAKATQLEFSVTAKTSATWKTAIDTNTCTEGTLKAPMINEGGSGEAVRLSVAASDFSWNSCTFANVTLEGGELEIKSIAGSTNGTMTIKGFSFTTSTPTYGSCAYTAGTGTPLGLLTASGTGEAVIDIETTLVKKSGGFICPNTMEWWEKWVQTAPSKKALYVEPS
jgi:hypothetical protein